MIKGKFSSRIQILPRLIFWTGAISASVYLGIPLFKELSTYTRCSRPVQACAVSGEVISISESEYATKIYYHFQVHGISHSSFSINPQPHYLNYPSALKAVDHILKSSPKTIYYNPHKPEQTAPSRQLPVKKVIYFITTIAIFAYLYHVSKINLFQNQDSIE